MLRLPRTAKCSAYQEGGVAGDCKCKWKWEWECALREMGRSEATATATAAIVVCSTYNLEWLKKRSAQTRPATALPSLPLLSPVQVQTRPAEQAVSVAEAKRVYLCRSLAVSTTHSVYLPVSLPASSLSLSPPLCVSLPIARHCILWWIWLTACKFVSICCVFPLRLPLGYQWIRHFTLYVAVGNSGLR